MADTPTVSVGAALPGEQFAQAAAMIFKFGDDLLLLLNSPAMLAARQREDVQAALLAMDDDLAKAQKTGDIAQIDKDASG